MSQNHALKHMVYVIQDLINQLLTDQSVRSFQNLITVMQNDRDGCLVET